MIRKDYEQFRPATGTWRSAGGRLTVRRTDYEGGSPRVRHTTARIRHLARRRGGRVAARGACAVMRKGRTTMRSRDLAKLVAGTMLAIALSILAASAQPLPPTSPPQLAPVLPPAYVVDLLTADGMAAFGAQWKHMEVKIVEGPALPNAMPGYKTSYDITPHAGVKGFDDSSWPTLEPKQLLDRRGGGKLSFLWYRTNLTMPAKIGVFDTANAKAVLDRKSVV